MQQRLVMSDSVSQCMRALKVVLNYVYICQLWEGLGKGLRPEPSGRCFFRAILLIKFE